MSAVCEGEAVKIVPGKALGAHHVMVLPSLSNSFSSMRYLAGGLRARVGAFRSVLTFGDFGFGSFAGAMGILSGGGEDQ